MNRYIDADKLIADLEHDIAVDTDMILYPGTDNMNASLYQNDKDIKQNCIEMLIKTPTADVRENVKGEWFNHYITQSENSLAFECSVCGMLSSGRHNYCPNCGADMRGEVND